jgi:hypothetical protein
VSIGTLDAPGELGLAVEIGAYVPGVDAAEAQRLVELADRTVPTPTPCAATSTRP